jgi:hypothetical protein
MTHLYYKTGIIFNNIHTLVLFFVGSDIIYSLIIVHWITVSIFNVFMCCT